MSKSEDSFASRWSRRKQQVRDKVESGRQDDEPAAEPTVPLDTIVPDGSVGRMQTRTEANRQADAAAREAIERGEAASVLLDADMPPIETLDEHSDFSGFMSPGVSEKLRKMALRRLFAGAGFNVRDGLDDYDEDFTNFEALGDLVTCDMKHRAEMEAQKKAEAERVAEAERERLIADGDERPAEQDAPEDDGEQALEEAGEQASLESAEGDAGEEPESGEGAPKKV